ncbi:hypothetical protein ABKS89_30400 [Pseudomonas sp. LABIM340]|uniref:hypothetical protein n=1 Tax=Pseudomonas sp. LABIM340 TaxID=3156585 RepID=UPI0032AF651D
MATLYSSIDTGAPTIAVGTGEAFYFGALKTILKGCLVGGYGSKPAAGWALVAEDTNYLVLRNGPGSGYICFTYTTNGFVRITLAATFDGVTSNIITGQGVKSGVAANNAVPQMIYIGSLAANSRFCWALAADSKSAVLTTFWYANNAGAQFENMTGQSQFGGSIAFGEDSGGNFLAIGGLNTATTPSSAINYFNATGMTVLRDPATGLLVDTGSIAPVTPLGITTAPVGTIVYPLERVDLVRYPWMTPTKDAGTLRGVTVQPNSIGYMNYALRSVGKGSAVGDLTLSNAANPFELVSGMPVSPLKTYYTNGGLFLTIDPRFW